MKPWLVTILRYLLKLFTPVALDVGVDAFPVITAGLTAAGEVVKLTDDELTMLNNPAMQASRHNALLQADRDRAAQDAQDALRTGNSVEIQKDLA